MTNYINVAVYPCETRPKLNAYYHCDLELTVVWAKTDCALK